MKLELLRPYLLILIPICIGFIIYTSKYMGKMLRWRRNTIITLRAIVITLLILAMSGLGIMWHVDETSTIFLVDTSDSMKQHIPQAEEFIKSAINEKSDKDKIGIMTFGENALIENFVTDNVAFSKFESEPQGTYTDIQGAINSAISLMPDNTKKRIVLISDGEENKGRSAELSSTLIEKGIDFKVLKIDRKINNEVAVDSIKVPQSLKIDEEFSVLIHISSTINTDAVLTIFRDREKVSTEKVKLSKGDNTFVFKDKATEGGFKSYRATIEPSSDTLLQNNEASAFTNIKAKPKILLIQDKEGAAQELANMLSSANMDYDLINAGSVPKSLSNLTKYKTVITCDVSAENLSNDFLNNLKVYVKELGGGFIATGGSDSYALGGYTNTPLEEILPVEMDLKGKKEIPSMAMLLIIDKSGSMDEGSNGINKIELAKEAAIRTVDSLRPNKDEIGVLAFDDTNYWVVNRAVIDNRENVKGLIGTLRAGGGTSIIPALKEGLESLKKSKASIKHIILLTDGQAERAGYESLIEEFNKEKITVSSVAVGSGADSELLENIAKGAKGRFYYTEDSSSIPKIFTKETYMVTRAYLNNRKFTPVVSNYHPVLNGVIDNGLPSLLGYIGASPKDRAKVILSSDEEDPILTVWQYGLGKTAAWNSDINGKWSANYINWEKNKKLWKNIIDYTIENYEDSDLSFDFNRVGSAMKITLKDNNFKEGSSAKVSIITPSLETINVDLNPSEPGKFSGEFEGKETGVYLIKGIENKGKDIVGSVNGGVTMQYSPEYNIRKEDSTLNLLVKGSNGKYIDKAEEVYKGNIEDITGRRSISNLLLLLSLIIFIMDIAMRRLNIPFNKFKYKIQKGLTKLKSTIKKPTKNNSRENSAFSEDIKKSINRKSTKNNKADKHIVSKNEKLESVYENKEKDNVVENHKNVKEKRSKKINSYENINDKKNSKLENDKKVKDKKKGQNESLDTSSLLKAKKRKKED